MRATKVIYIAGSITNNPDYMSQFGKAESKLTRQGYIVLTSYRFPQGLEHSEYMHLCFPMIDIADEVYFLDGWEHSKGARMEYDYARKNGKKLIFEE